MHANYCGPLDLHELVQSTFKRKLFNYITLH